MVAARPKADEPPSVSPPFTQLPSAVDSPHAIPSPDPPPPPSSASLEREQRRQQQLDSHLNLVRRRLSQIHGSRASRAASLNVRAGDVVIVYSSPTQMSPLRITPGSIFSNRYGHFHHSDFIGRPYASRVQARGSTGYVIPLHVTPELWTLSLTHRTQILYFADIALVLLQLDLRPGAVVLESGTGSGSLTTALARAVQPTGHVHTFEFNADRVAKAKRDFALLSLTPTVSVHHRDVCADGFPRVEGGVDAVFLDLPSPWLALGSCRAALRHLGRLASFSPCIEQVQRVVTGLHEAGWGEVRTMEVLQREFEVSETRVERMGRGKAGKAAEDKRRRDPAKRKSDDSAEQPAKRVKEDAAAEDEAKADPAPSSDVQEETKVPAEEVREDDDDVWVRRRRLREAVAGAGSLAGGVVSDGDVRYPLIMRSSSVARGHTGYLTFATCYRFSTP